MMKRAFLLCVTALFTALMGTMAVIKYVALRANLLDFGVFELNFSLQPNSACGNMQPLMLL